MYSSKQFVDKLSLRFPAEAILTYREEAIEATEHKDNYIEIEHAEIHEKLGTSYFYNGDYADCIGPLTTSHGIMRESKELAKTRAYFKVSLLLGIAHYRLGEIPLAEKYIIPCTTMKSVDPDLHAMALTNLAWVRLHQNRLVEASDKAMLAVEAAAKIFPHTSTEFMRCVRVQLIIFMRSGEFTKANMLLEDKDFSGQEKAILRSGCWTSMGMTDEAIIVLREESYKIPGTAASRQYLSVQQSRAAYDMLNGGDDDDEDWDEGDEDEIEDPLKALGGGLGSEFLSEMESAAATAQRDLRMLQSTKKMALKSLRQQPASQRFFNALILYNLAALYFRQPLHRSKALETIDDAISEMKAYQNLMTEERQRLVRNSLQVPLQLLNIQFTERPGSMSIPYCVSTDELTSPLIMLSHFMTARAEMELLCNPLDCAAVIQSGEVFTEVNARNVNSLSLLFESLTKKLDEITTSFTHEQIFEDDSYTSANGQVPPLPLGFAEEAAPVLSSHVPSPITDVLLTSSRPGTSGPTPRRPPSTPGASSLRQTMIEHNIWKAEEGGRPSTALGAGSPTVLGTVEGDNESSDESEDEDHGLPDIPRTNFDLEASIDMVDSYRALLDFANGPNQINTGATANAIGALKHRYGIQEDKSGKLMGAKKSFVRHPNQYVSPVHDAVSVRSELIPMMPIVGRDDVSFWIQWAVAQSQSFGFGFMGTGSLSTTPDGVSIFAIDGLSKAQLEYVRERLVSVEKKMSKKFDDDRKYRAGDRERMLLLNAVLAKVSAQLALRKEVGVYVKKMEDLNQLIFANSDKGLPSGAGGGNAKVAMRTTVYDNTYSALVKRFRLDFEEWDISEDMMSTARKKIGRWMQMLKIAKEYVAEAEQSGDVQLRRDSIKKIVNCYLEIVQAPLNDKSKPVPGKAGRRAGTPEDEETDPDEPPPTESALLAMGEEVIEEYETEDPVWIKKFGKLRAMHFASRLKYIVPQ